MADIRVINILPPQPVQNVTQSQVAGGDAPKINVVNFPVGSVLSGFIINRDNAGNPILRTENGDITFASQIFLKIGSEVSIRIEHIAGNTAAHLLTINGKEPELAAVQSAFAQEPEVIISGNLVGNKSVSASASVVIEEKTTTNNQQLATNNLIGKVIAPVISAENTPIIPTGTQISFKLLSVVNNVNFSASPSVVVGDKLAISTQPLTPNSQSLNPINAYTKTASATPSFAPIPDRHTDENRYAVIETNLDSDLSRNDAVVSSRLPTTNNQKPATTPPQIGNQITATVLKTEANGEAIVQTPIGLVRVNLNNQTSDKITEKIAVGSEITFEITTIETPEKLVAENAALATALNAAVAITPASITQLARSAGALSDIFSLLSGFGSFSALDFVENKIPTISLGAGSVGETAQNNKPTASFPATLLGFAVALKTGDFREWLGRTNAKWLEENGHENLLKKAEGEFLSLSRQFVDAPPNSWQSLFFPVAVEGVLQQARLFVKRDKKEKTVDGERKTEEDTRFVVEMDLTNLGQMQMDGFVRRNAQKTQFDLIIRSHTQLSADAQKDILQIYNDTGAITGYSGSIIFQTSKDFSVNPMEEITSGKHEGFLA